MNYELLNEYYNDDKKEEKLTKAGKSFRERFKNALIKLEERFLEELDNAESINDIRTKINISSVLKEAKASPLAAYSEKHKDFVEKIINDCNKKCEESVLIKFKSDHKPTIEELQKQLREERELYKKELSKLASQKMTEYLKLI